MKKIILLLALSGLIGCSSNHSDQGAAGSMDAGSVGSEGNSRRLHDLEEKGGDTEKNATRSFGGSGGSAPGGAVGPH